MFALCQIHRPCSFIQQQGGCSGLATSGACAVCTGVVVSLLCNMQIHVNRQQAFALRHTHCQARYPITLCTQHEPVQSWWSGRGYSVPASRCRNVSSASEWMTGYLRDRDIIKNEIVPVPSGDQSARIYFFWYWSWNTRGAKKVNIPPEDRRFEVSLVEFVWAKLANHLAHGTNQRQEWM